MSDKQSQQPKRWLVPFPEKKARTGHPCQDACNGNQKMGYLLNYFLCEASWELERQDLPESCKVVKFTRSHEHILKRVNISEKSLVQFLKQFNAWEFVLSEQYGKTFTVQAGPIRKAMYNPVFTKKVRQKSCTSTSENTTTSCQDDDTEKSCNVYLLQQKVEALEEVQLYNIALEARIQALSEALEEESCKVVKLGQEVEAGKLYNSTLSTWIEAVSQALKIPSPFIDSGDIDLRDSNKESNSAHTDTDTFAPPHVGALSLPQSIDIDYHSQSLPLSSTVTTRNEEGAPDHAHPLQPLPAANHPDRGSSHVPSRDSQVDSTGFTSPLDTPPVDRAAGSDATGREGRAGVAEDTARGIGSREAREADAQGDTARGQVTEGDEHGHSADIHHRNADTRSLGHPGTRVLGDQGRAQREGEGTPARNVATGDHPAETQVEKVAHGLVGMASPGHPRGLGNVAAPSGDRNVPAVDDRWVVAPETGPDVATGQEEIDTLGRAWQSVDDEQTASREDVLVVAASPLDTSPVEPGESEKGTLPVAPVSKWSAATLIVRAEQLRKKPFSETARPKEVKAAQRMFKRKPDLTLSEFEQAWKHWDTQWWRETNGPFTVTDLAAVPKNKSEMRLIIALEKLALPKAGQVISISRQPVVYSSFDDPNYDMSSEFYPSEAERSNARVQAQ